MGTPSARPGPATAVRRRSVVSFADRGGRMTAGQQRAWERLWPHLGATADDVVRDADGRLDAPAWFGRHAPLRLEIGSGMGETTAELAAVEPDCDHLAVEVYPPGLAQLAMRADERGIANLRLLRADAIDVLADLVAPGSLAGLRIFYPDPWPKRRHHKRRLIQPAAVTLMASRLAPGATLHLATDVADYAEHMLEVVSDEPQLDNPHGGFAPRPAWRPRTKFETRAEVEGRPSRDLLLVRNAVPAPDSRDDSRAGDRAAWPRDEDTTPVSSWRDE